MKIRIYTDGACSGNPGPGGWAAVILFPQQKQEITGYEYDTTNNRMELKAVIEAIKVAKSANSNYKIDLYSDSSYVVNSVNQGWLKRWSMNGWVTTDGKSVKNQDLWMLLKRILDKHGDIHFIRVKGHSSNEYNNLCDALARKEVNKIKAE